MKILTNKKLQEIADTKLTVDLHEAADFVVRANVLNDDGQDEFPRSELAKDHFEAAVALTSAVMTAARKHKRNKGTSFYFATGEWSKPYRPHIYRVDADDALGLSYYYFVGELEEVIPKLKAMETNWISTED